MVRHWLFGFLIVTFIEINPVNAQPDSTCFAAAAAAASSSGVSLNILKAITLTETGRQGNAGQLEPWPWTVNIGGKGHWFDSRDAAVEFVLGKQAEGFSNIDLGCFQLNLHWHGGAFASIDQMLDPMSNAAYAAQFLSDLHKKFVDWKQAVGAYHSNTPERANAYINRLEQLYAAHLNPDSLQRPPPKVSINSSDDRSNAYCLVVAKGPIIQSNRMAGPLIGGLK